MNLFRISLRNLHVRKLSSTLTTVSIAVGAMLVAALWLLTEETKRKYTASMEGYDAIVGPPAGSPLELVLNTIFGIRSSVGFVPFSVYRELHDKRGLARKVRTRYAIPQARGDNYRNFPIIGTTDEMFTKFGTLRRDENGKRQPVLLEFDEGRRFNFGHEDFVAFAEKVAADKAAGQTGNGGAPAADANDHGHSHAGTGFQPHPWREAVIGYDVASQLGLGLHSLITPVHGSADEVGAHVHTESMCEVVGILARTGTAVDRSIFIPISQFLSIDDHETIRDSQETTADNIGLSAIVFASFAHLGGANLRYEFQTRTDAKVAWPEFEIPELLKLVGNATDLLRVVSWLVLVVAGVSILVALYNTMNERRREIAIMRSLGARRHQIVRIILQEAVMVSLLGAVLGVAACHAAAWALSGTVADITGVLVDWSTFTSAELWLILGACGLGGLAGLLPAIKGSMTEVADNLGPIS